MAHENRAIAPAPRFRELLEWLADRPSRASPPPAYSTAVAARFALLNLMAYPHSHARRRRSQRGRQ